MLVVTGATGKLGRHVVESLLERVPASEIAVVVRNADKAADFAARGVEVRVADYAKPETLGAVFKASDKVLLISSNELGQRAQHHQAVVAAAKTAGVAFLAYTSILRASESGLALAAEHKATEIAIQASGLPFAILRNGWYTENYTENLAAALEHGALLGAADEGRVATAPRADYAAAAANVLLASTEHANEIYELAGDTAFTLAELAAAVAKASGKSVLYSNLPADKYAEALVGFGVPAPYASMLADSDRGLSRGELNDTSGHLRRLIGRPTTGLAETLAVTFANRKS